MKAHRYAILPLFAFGLAASGPALAGEGAGPDASKAAEEGLEVRQDERTGDTRRVPDANEQDEERATLPYEEDPDQNDPGTGGAATQGTGTGGDADSDGGAAGGGGGSGTQ